jgi:hypothetical protein
MLRSRSPDLVAQEHAVWVTATGLARAEFRLAVHALARQLSTTPLLVNYKNRRDALQDWCIDTAAWQDIISQLPPTKGPFQPELSDCKRQFASCPVPRPRCRAGQAGRGLRRGRRLPGLRHLDTLISLWRRQQEPAAAGPRTWC